MQGGYGKIHLIQFGNSPAVKKELNPTDTFQLECCKNEIEILNIVQYFDSAVVDNGPGLASVSIVLEYCQGQLINLMNSRLSNRLTEAEIVQIMVDVVSAVDYLHCQAPIIVHRDLKVENVLFVSGNGFNGQPTYKICDFGSATCKTIPYGQVLTSAEIKRLEQEIDLVTTLQYRSPELCDLYQRRGISEKVDIWALGVLLYKLCFYTTPFENEGKLAILSGRYSLPPMPVYSGQLLQLIENLLVVDPRKRPSAIQVLQRLVAMAPASRATSINNRLSSNQALNGTFYTPSMSSTPVQYFSPSMGNTATLQERHSNTNTPPPSNYVLLDGPVANTQVSNPQLHGLFLQQSATFFPMNPGLPRDSVSSQMSQNAINFVPVPRTEDKAVSDTKTKSLMDGLAAFDPFSETSTSSSSYASLDDFTRANHHRIPPQGPLQQNSSNWATF